MIHFDLPKEKSSIIKVIGIGGGGSNAVNHMYSQNIEGVNFIICNTDAQSITQSTVPNKVQLGPHLTQGLGAGANPDIGRQATEESLEEIKRILEVNTKMAFVTAGMGGGTGTGGAPIISKICKDLGILTVGIVTTPFSYEGRKRQMQAEEGIKNLKQYVDTLLVISNDKLRHQFGNLKMRDAFAKADNVLATAAKCITDVINSTGQINVDFADVCTVMKNGGVAILGNAACEGEDRAQRAIEDALNSPLLNDNDIRGAKWILININSAEGEHEFTMDEVEIIQTHLLSQAGENTDVILGLGYDNSLGEKIGITLIATGFEHKDPFVKKVAIKHQPQEEKIVMTLGEKEAPRAAPVIEEKTEDVLAPTLVDEEENITDIPMPQLSFKEEEEPQGPRELFSLDGTATKEEEPKEEAPAPAIQLRFVTDEEDTAAAEREKERVEMERKKQALEDKFEALRQNILGGQKTAPSQNAPAAGAGGYLSRPSNIYSEPKKETPQANTRDDAKPSLVNVFKEDEVSDMKLVIKAEAQSEEKPSADAPQTPQAKAGEQQPVNDAGDDKQRATDRLQKLRNLSFNLNAADPNNEYENVPAYIRRNMDLQQGRSAVENFYSNYTVKSDGKNNATISTINTFLDGKKPD
ncbi:cell division protein FtsZ [Flavisolibacter ginsenosidimutans]|uniref:Cell division protein FtsZ n=1 Tax=Flavisolibacter ginsenosidimutans TaxID=661481 RepID=A0A5B8UHP7_9BACT|nr:cell division protein FtsZ [Flavisolibacter ginsenosidimutans]QEC56028.1 cell division protein FtsZ [Flavisolibacter ginsenosidimutans]